MNGNEVYLFCNLGEKELKSVSMRVRDAAESLLALLMEQLVKK